MQSIISIDIGILHLAVIKVGFFGGQREQAYDYTVLQLGLFDVKDGVAARMKQDRQKSQAQHTGELLIDHLLPFTKTQPGEELIAIVIEQQFGFGGNANNGMKSLSHRIHQIFVSHFYPSVHTELVPPLICFVSAASKFKVQQLPQQILDSGGLDPDQLATKPLRKRYSVALVKLYIEEDSSGRQWPDLPRIYFANLHHSTNKAKNKQDDIADVFLQALAYYELRVLKKNKK